MKKILYLVAGLLLAGAATAEISVVNSEGTNIVSGTFAYDYTMREIDSVLVVATYRDSGGQPFANITFDGIEADGSNYEGSRRTSMFYCLNPGNGTVRIQGELVAASSGMYVWELSGVNKSAAVVSVMSEKNDYSPGSLTIETLADYSFIVDAMGWNPINGDSANILTVTPDADSILPGTNFTYGINLGGGGCLAGGSGPTTTSGSYNLGWNVSQSQGSMDDFNELAFAFAPSGEIVLPNMSDQYPAPNSYVVNPLDFPVSIGGVITDSADVNVNPESIELYLNGSADVLAAGDVSQILTTPATTTVSYAATTLPDGTNTVELVYSTVNFPSVMTTSSWSFVVYSQGEPGSRVYVDADPTNTLAWNGTEYADWSATGGTNWTSRADAGNAGESYQSDYSADSVRLKTSITDLPEGLYKVYAYFWAAGSGANWRMEAALEDNTAGELPLYYQSDYPAKTNLYVHYEDALDALPWGNFAYPTPNPYMTTNLLSNPFGSDALRLAKNDLRLVEIYLGVVSGSEISVYVDDDPAASSQTQRTWYDGIGYEAFEATAPSIINQYPAENSDIISPDDLPVSIGAEIADSTSAHVNPASVQMYLNGGENVLMSGEVTQSGVSLKTTVIDHTASTLEEGTNTVELVYATLEYPTLFTTITWSFVVHSRGEPGNIVYVDASPENTLSWNGTMYGVWSPEGGTNWTVRNGSGIGGVVYQSEYYGDSVRLKTTLSGLSSGTYNVYAYFWAAGGSANWRLGASLEDVPGGELPLYHQSDYPANTDLHVYYEDGVGALPWGNFSNPTPNPFMSTNLLTNPFGSDSIILANNDTRLVQVYLGTVSGDEITVYVDDDVTANSQLHRTWYEGLGYEPVVSTLNPDITSLSISGGQATLIWKSEAGGIYTIQHKSTLTGPWADLKSGISGGSPTTTDSVDVSGGSQEFFQIKGN
ncbi:MAG: hypothetical protein JXR25_02570 [Pontiellaceae bacterium]|nr:hypothetical protein [Pontiellaceae bacterium]MBN2783686.1 hypothetical protein [Pontiellaceae bacterium]